MIFNPITKKLINRDTYRILHTVPCAWTENPLRTFTMSDVTTEDTEIIHSVSPQTPPTLEIGTNTTNLESDIVPFIHDVSN